MKLILVRHGETIANSQFRLDGQYDTELSEKGEKQIQLLSKFLKKVHIDRIFCSPLRRSKKTALAIAKHRNISPIERKELLEIDCGACTMMKRSEVIKKYPSLVKGWKDNTDPPFPEGESLRDVESRVMPFIKELVSKFQNETILISGHGSLNVCILGYYLNIKPGLRFKIKQDNCAINILSFNKSDFSIDAVNLLPDALFFQK